MGRAKGTPKTGGRKKGTPNKSTPSVKEAIGLLLKMYSAPQDADEDNPEGMSLMLQDWLCLKPNERIAMAEKLMQYSVPKMQAVAISGDEEKPVTIESMLRKQAAESEK